MTAYESTTDRYRRLADEAHTLVGKQVCVHGRGFGKVVRVDADERYPGPRMVVEIPRTDRHEPSGRRISWKDTASVLLDVYPAHFSTEAA